MRKGSRAERTMRLVHQADCQRPDSRRPSASRAEARSSRSRAQSRHLEARSRHLVIERITLPRYPHWCTPMPSSIAPRAVLLAALAAPLIVAGGAAAQQATPAAVSTPRGLPPDSAVLAIIKQRVDEKRSAG